MLLSVPQVHVARMRPDILVVEKMRLLGPSTHDMTDLQVLARFFQARCLVHVIEVGYCAESSSFRDARSRMEGLSA